MENDQDGEGYVDSYVAFMDILGFSELTNKADNHPEWRDFLASSISQMNNMLPSPNKDIGFRFTQFSDCIVMSVHRSDVSLANILRLSANLALQLFHRGLLMRGGIASGNFRHDERIMFGPALIKAHAFDKPGAPPHIALHDDIIRDINDMDRDGVLSQWVCQDPWDLSPILHTLSRFEHYPQAGDFAYLDDGKVLADGIKKNATDMQQVANVRAKWRWLQDYWNRTVAVRGKLMESI